MAQGVITSKGREKLCKAHAGDISLPKILKMAFGNGGIDENGVVRNTTGSEVTLQSELLQKEIDGHVFPESTTCRFSCRLEKDDLPNESISEQGLIDEEGDLIAYKTFLAKGKDADMEFVFDMDEIF